MEQKMTNYKFWYVLSQVKSGQKLKQIIESFLGELCNICFYANIGFILPAITNTYPELDKILQKYCTNNKNELNKLLEKLFSHLKSHPEAYLYKLVQQKEKFEILNRHTLHDVLKDLNNEAISQGYQNLWKNYRTYYLTIYYGKDVFVLDSLLVFKNEPEDSVIDYIKASLQYLAGFLMSQIARNYALRSAVASIMSRNMSHNIGSHVLAKMGYTEPSNINIPGSQVLYKYLQQRMDFVALISTEFPEWSCPAWFIKEVMYWFYQQNTLLNHIAEQEGIKRAFKWDKNKDDFENESTLLIRLKIRLKIKDKWKDKWIVHEDNSKLSKNNLLENDFPIAIPGGIVGYHAFYVILENIIRNSAKHDWANLSSEEKKKKKQLKITIEVENEPEKEHVTFKIYTNVSETQNDKNCLPVKLDKCDKESNSLSLHQRINCKLIKKFIKDTGELIRENWGLAEMKISAGFLQKRKIEEIGAEGEPILGIIKAISKKDPEENSKYRLCYEFKVPKPKEVGIIGKVNNELEKILNKDEGEARKHGIYYNPDDFDYEFLILVDEENILPSCNSDKWEFEIEKLPYRLFVLTENEEFEENLRIVPVKFSEIKNWLKNVNDPDYENLKLKLYEKWINKIKEISSIDGDFEIKIDLGGQSQSMWSLELFKKLENLVKQYAIAKGKERNKVNNGYNRTLNKKDVKEGKVDPFNWFFEHELQLKNAVEEEFKESLFMLKEVQNLPECYRYNKGNENKLSNNSSNSNKNKIEIKRHHLPENVFYGEEISGVCSHFLVLSNYKNKEDKLHFQILENAIFKILIIDERVIDFIKDKPEEIKERYKRSRIYVPYDKSGVSIKLDRTNYIHKWLQTENNVLLDLSALNNKEYQILIIHQGILDKMGVDPIKFVREVKKNIPFVVVTSGRGEPENVPKNAKFMSYSIIESTLLKDYHEKFILTQIIMNLKNRREKV